MISTMRQDNNAVKIALKDHPIFRKPKGPVVQIILDGFGYGDLGFEYNVVTPTYVPAFFNLFHPDRPHCAVIGASARYVGLDNDVVGNSEVGHNSVGAGQYKDQGGRLVNQGVQSGSLMKSPVWNDHVIGPILQSQSTSSQRTLHLLGLIQDTTIIHSDVRHMLALIDDAAAKGVRSLAIHGLTDGRDDPDRHAVDLFRQLEEKCAAINKKHSGYHYRVASGGGRMRMTMDRYEDNWNMVKLGWDAHVLGRVNTSTGGVYTRKASDAIAAYYVNPDPKFGEIDQYVYPFVVVDEHGQPIGTIQDGDSVVFTNFRGDRAIEISKAFEDPSFNVFDRERMPKVQYAGMMLYDGDNNIPQQFLVTAPGYTNTMAEILTSNGVAMFAISETAKFGHVTYFADGNRSNVKERYTYKQIKGDPVEMYVSHPQMKVAEITHQAIDYIRSGRFRFGRINLANPDMIGHTGNWEAVKHAMASVNLQIEMLLKAIQEAEGIALVFADHGNADEMVRRKKDGSIEMREGKPVPNMSHTMAPVPLLVVDASGQQIPFRLDTTDAVPEKLRGDVPGAGLLNVAATTLNLMGYEAPEFYWPSLLRSR